MTTMAAPEQLLLEMINRARLDPAGEAARLGIDLNEGLAAGTISLDPKQPLAGNNLLAQAAEGHSNVMLSVKGFGRRAGPEPGGTPTLRPATERQASVSQPRATARTRFRFGRMRTSPHKPPPRRSPTL